MRTEQLQPEIRSRAVRRPPQKENTVANDAKSEFTKGFSRLAGSPDLSAAWEEVRAGRGAP